MSNELKKIQLDMLKVFIDICEKYNLKYYMLGGSCLGAVRHNGYIPWDDDIDVGLYRKDYEKFLSVCQNELPSNLFLQTIYTDKEYLSNFAKLRNSNTTFIEKAMKNLHINHGVYIDIFPLDEYCHSKIDNFKIYLCQLFLSFKLNFENMSLKYRMLRKLTSILNVNLDKLKFKKDKLLRKYENSNAASVRNFCGIWQEREITEKSVFGDGLKIKFENLDVVIPQKYDDYLTKLYGDYMTLPPEEERIPHHYCEIIDFEKPYTEYTVNNH